jgi:hypothetical protein
MVERGDIRGARASHPLRQEFDRFQGGGEQRHAGEFFRRVRPMMACMSCIEAIRRTGGKTDGDSFIGAVKGMSWESPLGPTTIDPETRDVISNIYLRRVERVNGELWNIEFATVENFKDPVKPAKK